MFDSADIKEEADWTAMGIWFNSGQDCCAGSRVYVQEKVYEEFLAALKQRAESVAIGKVSVSPSTACPSVQRSC